MPHVTKTIRNDSEFVQGSVSNISYVMPILGAGIGLLVGGPFGSIIGTASGQTMKSIFDFFNDEYKSRQLSSLQKIRLNFSIELLVSEITKEIIDNKRTVRGDHLFRFDRYGNITDGQLLEVYFNIITQENDECKIRAITYAIKNWILDESINQNVGHQIIKQIQSFSCLQIRIIGLYNKLYKKREKKIEINGKTFGFNSFTPYSQDGIEDDLQLQSFLDEYQYLLDHRILTALGNFGAMGSVPAHIDLSGYGKKLAEMMEVEIMDPELFRDFIKFLTYSEKDFFK